MFLQLGFMSKLQFTLLPAFITGAITLSDTQEDWNPTVQSCCLDGDAYKQMLKGHVTDRRWLMINYFDERIWKKTEVWSENLLYSIVTKRTIRLGDW